MSSPVSGTTGTFPTSPASTTVTRTDQGSQKDMFLKLLVAQMKYQDPSNPASSSELMAQNATFAQVEKLEEIAKQNASLLALQRSSSAGALVGVADRAPDERAGAAGALQREERGVLLRDLLQLCLLYTSPSPRDS